MGQQMIGDGTYGQSAPIVASRQIVKLRCFHLDGQNPMTRHLLVEVGALIIKDI